MRAVLPPDSWPGDEVRLQAVQRVEDEVLVCQCCPLAQTRTCAVPGEGNLNTVVMFVGEGPGFDEDRQGRPFVGRSGQYLTDTLANLGICLL